MPRTVAELPESAKEAATRHRRPGEIPSASPPGLPPWCSPGLTASPPPCPPSQTLQAFGGCLAGKGIARLLGLVFPSHFYLLVFLERILGAQSRSRTARSGISYEVASPPGLPIGASDPRGLSPGPTPAHSLSAAGRAAGPFARGRSGHTGQDGQMPPREAAGHRRTRSRVRSVVRDDLQRLCARPWAARGDGGGDVTVTHSSGPQDSVLSLSWLQRRGHGGVQGPGRGAMHMHTCTEVPRVSQLCPREGHRPRQRLLRARRSVPVAR